ncbi:actin organization and endocytosis protein [Massospora cicadina]|nr:actin organization and endocytosis protein [Massospora cicadina]
MNGTGELRGTPWRMSEEEYTKYRQVFAGQTNQAYLQANQARDLFAQSGLPTPILFQIWNLADTKRSGQLDVDRFAIALHLIFQKLAGHPFHNIFPGAGTRPAGASSKVPKGEKDDPFKPNAAPVSETEWQVTRERYNAVAEWLPLIGAAQSRFACELKRLDELEAQSSSGEFMGQIAQIDARIKAARVELFSIEDAEQHGYSPATPSNNLLEFDLGTDSISQKAALMLQQRLQALQMKAPIPADAQLRLEAYRRDLESELLANDVAHPTLGELRDLKSRFVEQAALYRAKVHTLQTLNKETEKWFVGKGASTHELRCFLESLSPPKINPATTLPPSATQVDPLAAPAPVASVKPKVPPPMPHRKPSPPVMRTKPKVPPPVPHRKPSPLVVRTKPKIPPPIPHEKPHKPPQATPQHEASKAPPPVEQEALHLIAQATRLARAKARSMERSQAAAPVSPKRQPIGSVQKSSQMPSVTVSREEQPLGSSIGDVRAVAPASSNHQPAGSVHGKFQVPCITVSKEERRRQTEQQLGPSIGEIRAAARLARLQALEKLQVGAPAEPPKPKHRSSLKRPPSTPKSAPSPSRALHAPPSAQDEPSNLPQPTNLRASPERANPEDVAGLN